MTDAKFIPDRLTSLEYPQAMAALRDGYRILMGDYPEATCLACHFSQAVLETGHFRSMHCFNFTNVKRGADWDGCWTAYGCGESSKDMATIQRWVKSGGRATSATSVWFDPPHPQTHFRAFLSEAKGAEDHLAFLALRERYRAAWSEAHAGKPGRFARALGAAGFYTADPAKYEKALVQIYEKVLPSAQAALAGLPIVDLAHLEGLWSTTAALALRGSTRQLAQALVA